jgi:hypothetical protein
MQFSPPSGHSIPLWSKYSSQHPVLRHPQFMLLSYCQRPCLHPCKSTGKIIVFQQFAIIIFGTICNLKSTGHYTRTCPLVCYSLTSLRVPVSNRRCSLPELPNSVPHPERANSILLDPLHKRKLLFSWSGLWTSDLRLLLSSTDLLQLTHRYCLMTDNFHETENKLRLMVRRSVYLCVEPSFLGSTINFFFWSEHFLTQKSGSLSDERTSR